LLGREKERQRLADLLNGAREGHGGAVVLRGEAGIGKSALIQDLVEQAQDCLICRAVGVESELELPYAGLQQLCGPVTGRLADLPPLHRNALDKVFGLTTGLPPDRFLVGMAVLDLITRVAQRQPLLWLVDDAQWLDRSSIRAIGFAGRRLLQERIFIAIGARDSFDDGDLAGLPDIRIGGLTQIRGLWDCR
jgi:hypothetical protein